MHLSEVNFDFYMANLAFKVNLIHVDFAIIAFEVKFEVTLANIVLEVKFEFYMRIIAFRVKFEFCMANVAFKVKLIQSFL